MSTISSCMKQNYVLALLNLEFKFSKFSLIINPFENFNFYKIHFILLEKKRRKAKHFKYDFGVQPYSYKGIFAPIFRILRQ